MGDRTGFPGLSMALPLELNFLMLGSGLQLLTGTRYSSPGKRSKREEGKKKEDKPVHYPELGKLHRAWPRAWSTRSCRQAARVSRAPMRPRGGGWMLG